jgi:uncharacterized protein (TIGR03086 family)
VDLRPFYEQAAKETVRIVSNIDAARLQDSTPCSDWNVRQLMNHMIRGNKRFAAFAVGETFDAPREQDFTGEDPSASFAASVEAVVEGFGSPGAMERTFDLPFGAMPGAQAVRIALLEAVVHGWDVARATGQQAQAFDAIAGQMLVGLKQMLPGGERPAELPFANEVAPPEGAKPIEQLVAFLGRDPRA